MIKTLIKRNISSKIWAALRAKKRYMLSLFKESSLDVKLKSERKIVIIGVADYNNLGDHAIAEAQRRFLKQFVGNNSNYKILEIPSHTPVRDIESILNDTDIILFTGGGNLGTKYNFLHDIYLPIIKNHPNNKKLFFPQSYTFNEDDSQKLISKIKLLFAASGLNLTITARESKSYELFKKMFPMNNVIITPDIVLSLNNNQHVEDKRYDVLIMLRTDSEKVTDKNIQEEIISKLKSKYRIKYSDTVTDYNIMPENRLNELNIKWNEIKQSKVVITDRLHGMIFAQISGTPCVAFDNYNSKIKMTYEDWLNDNENIVFVDPRKGIDINKFVEMASKLMDQSAKEFYIDKKYEPLSEIIKKLIK